MLNNYRNTFLSTSPTPPSNNSHFQKQIDLAAASRQSSGQHHHARISIAANRNNQADSTPWSALDLGGMQLRNLSVDLFKYTFLTTLYLNHNNLLNISVDISSLKNLKILDLSGNRLQSLPQEIGLLSNLVQLLLIDNDIHSIPHEMGFLYQLETLGIEGNPFSVTEPISSLMQKTPLALS